MRRREFITMLAGGTPLGAWSLAARAQQPGKPPTIGFLGPSSAETWSQWTKAFVDRLGELGWVDGRTVNIVYRWGHGHIDRFGVIAAELVNLKVDLILTAGSATLQAKKETSEIPIVFALASEPVVTGMVASYYVVIGGGVNEVFLRIEALHRLARAMPALVGMAHLTVMVLFAGLLLYFNASLLMRRPRVT